MFGLSQRRRQGMLHRATAAFCAASLALATLAIPLPLPQEKDASEPYPCMNCACGCANAEMCWRECCCHTHAEKLAWARKNGVTPPAFVVALAQAEVAKSATECQKPCCQDKTHEEDLADLPPCCRARELARREQQACETEVCERQGSCCSKKKQAAKKRPASGVIVLQALKCRGVSVSISLLPPCVPEMATMPLDLHNVASEQVALFDHFYAGVSDTPDIPPPRLYV